MKTEFPFPRSSRLLNAGDYKTVFDGAEVKVSDKHLLILARPNQLSHPRVGLVIAKKHIRLAVHRNRVKRVIRESFRLTSSRLPNLDIVVLARKGMGELDNRSLHQLANNSWTRLVKYSRKRLGASLNTKTSS
ncbi:ribonuclease P protein component [Motiliproteus sp. MSK22-1]|uniref:ribonuclease P protein component n=1 Tax=Motiliproteus sp. MSK22-1 TaxID=1897630 RepID=UPI000975D6E8|nr:ribonuclease P protein component [Motiliproteus sp. MSK22-1]